MSKYNSLLKRTEVFERLANLSSTKNFLEAIAQALPQGIVTFPDTSLTDLLGRVTGAASNLAGMLANNSDLADERGQIAQMASSLEKARSTNYYSSRDQLDRETNAVRGTLNALMNMETSLNNAGLNPAAKSMLKMLKQEAENAQNAIVSFYRNQGFPTVDYAQKPEEKAVPQAVPPRAAPKPAESAKRLANALVARVDALPEGPQRTTQLSMIDAGVKALQKLFRNLKTSLGLQDYFARMEIVRALQKVYSTLDYDDLAVVKSLDNGRGVPDSPDATI